MTYLEKTDKEVVKYFKLLSNNFPAFIDKYINTEEMQRLSGIGQFCGCDYTKLHSCKYWYSRLDHSITCALMTWHFTKNKAQTLSALFHDLGTPAFSHCIDYLLNDTLKQESSEKNVENVIRNSKKLLNLLQKDNIKIEDIVDIEKYPIVENKKPKICVDRLDGVLGTGLIWCHFWNLKDIEEIYSDIAILTNENDELEIGFNNKKVAEKFFEGVFKYSIVLQQNEDKFTMQFIADILKELIKNKIIEYDDLYKLSEQDIIKIIKNDNKLKFKWEKFEKAETLIRTDLKPEKYYVSVESKKRYVVPLVKVNNKNVRLNTVSKKCDDLLEQYLKFSDSKYSYIE